MTSERAALAAFFEEIDADWTNDNIRPGTFAFRFRHAADRLRAALAATPAPREDGPLRAAALLVKAEHDANGHREPCGICAALAAGEHREDGWEELQREIEALPEANDGTAGEWSLVDRAAVLAIVDRLAAARGEPPEAGPAIDEDELARALHRLGFDLRTRPTDPRPFGAVATARRIDAHALIVALATPTTPEPTTDD